MSGFSRRKKETENEWSSDPEVDVLCNLVMRMELEGVSNHRKLPKEWLLVQQQPQDDEAPQLVKIIRREHNPEKQVLILVLKLKFVYKYLFS